LVTWDRQRVVARILNQLAPRDREMLRMIFLEERDKVDICRIMQVNPEYLRVLVYRAKARFRDALEESHSSVEKKPGLGETKRTRTSLDYEAL